MTHAYAQTNLVVTHHVVHFDSARGICISTNYPASLSSQHRHHKCKYQLPNLVVQCDLM